MLFKFEPPFVFSTKVETHSTIKENLYEKICKFYKENRKDETFKWSEESLTNVITNYHYWDKEEFVKIFDNNFFKEVIWNPLDMMYSELNYFAKTSNVTHIWWNYYKKGDYAEYHDHGKKATISGVYFLKLNETNKTVFVCNNEIKTQRHITDYVEEGSVILFPSALGHYVLPSEEDRITISFNIKTIF
jgi:hypothetical protein